MLCYTFSLSYPYWRKWEQIVLTAPRWD